MTREEAKRRIECCRNFLANNYSDMGEPNFTAFNMAIKALEQEPKFIAKADGTIEQIKNCDDCLFKKEWEKIGKSISVILEKQTEREPMSEIEPQERSDKE